MSNQDNTLSQIELERHLQFQSLLAELSASFVRVPTNMIDQEIEESLRRIAENLDLDSISLGLITADGQDFYSGYRYAKPGKKPWQANSLASEGPFLTKTLLAGKPFIMHDVEALPPEGAVDREGFLNYDTRAALIFPFIVGGHLCGAISFASSRPQQWPDHVLRGLGLIADVYANVLERKRNLQALQWKEEQMRLAAESADIGLWVWNIQQDTIWATDRAHDIYGVPYDEKLNLQRFLACLHPEDHERVKEVIQEAFRVGSDFQEEYRVVHSDGSEYWICATSKCQLGDSGFPERMTGASLNITDIRRTQQELEHANNELKTALEENRRLKDRFQQENIYLRHEIAERKGSQIVNGSAAMRLILTQIRQVAPTPASVLIMGETGTGKELVATAIHEASPRKDRPMIRVNCAAIPAALIESELFGREKGAYTGALSKQIGRFELADGSTLFLDEVTELPMDAQSKCCGYCKKNKLNAWAAPKRLMWTSGSSPLPTEICLRKWQRGVFVKIFIID
jgi:PAS domain S-box-containing protein